MFLYDLCLAIKQNKFKIHSDEKKMGTADRVVRIASYFNRQFKKQEHMTPNTYREAVRNKHNY